MDKQDIINYVLDTPTNTNPAILGQMLDSIEGEGGGESVTTYKTTITLSGGTAYAELVFLDGVVLNDCENQTREVSITPTGCIRLTTDTYNVVINSQNKVNCNTYFGDFERTVYIEPTADNASVLLVTNSND